MLTESSENESSNSDPNYAIRKNDSSAEFVASLEKLCLENINRLIFGHLNIKSIRNKLGLLTNVIQGKFDILLVSETKIDIYFPSGQFIIPGFATPYRFDRNRKGGGLLFCLREVVARLFLQSSKNLFSDFLKEISKVLELPTSNCEHFSIMGDLNSEVKEKYLTEFCQLYNFKKLINMPSFKNPSNPSCRDVILTNHPRSFQNSLVIDTGLSDFHRMTVTVMKTYFPKLCSKLINYRDFQKFSNAAFRDELLTNLCHIAPNYDDFIKMVNRVLFYKDG